MIIKPSEVKFISDEAETGFNALAEDSPLKKFINRAKEDLKKNAFCGIQIPKRLFPKEYIKEYSINNLWKYDLPDGWRLIYTITSKNEIELISVILEWFNHKNYERKFKYNK